jgi:uncharacterized protein (DUF3820 family)
MTKLTDEFKINFGKYAGYKLANIPASYLLWLKENFIKKGIRKLWEHEKQLLEYINDNLEVLNKEIKGGKK